MGLNVKIPEVITSGLNFVRRNVGSSCSCHAVNVLGFVPAVSRAGKLHKAPQEVLVPSDMLSMCFHVQHIPVYRFCQFHLRLFGDEKDFILFCHTHSPFPIQFPHIMYTFTFLLCCHHSHLVSVFSSEINNTFENCLLVFQTVMVDLSNESAKWWNHRRL